MKKKPIRTCFICRNSGEKFELNRIVKNKEGDIFFDRSKKANGRGAYICNSPDCLEKVKKQKILNRAFKCELDNSVMKNYVRK